MRYISKALGLVLVMSPAFGAGQPQANDSSVSSAGFVVVVQAANETTKSTRADLARIFLRKSGRWPDGTDVRAVDQSLASEVRASFSQQVLQLSALAVQAYWRRALYSGGDVPPRVLQSDEDVLAYVAENEGAVGYVSAAATLPETVKQLEVTK